MIVSARNRLFHNALSKGVPTLKAQQRLGLWVMWGRGGVIEKYIYFFLWIEYQYFFYEYHCNNFFQNFQYHPRKYFEGHGLRRRVTLFMILKMNDQYYGPRISPAEVLLERPKRTQKAAGNPVSRSLLYPRPSVAGVVKKFFSEASQSMQGLEHRVRALPGFCFRIDRRFSSVKRGGAFRRRVSNGVGRSLGLKA